MGKTFSEIHKDERLTDNSSIEYCAECRNCKHREPNTQYSEGYRKGFCKKYPMGVYKPLYVMNNGACEQWEYDSEA